MLYLITCPSFPYLSSHFWSLGGFEPSRQVSYLLTTCKLPNKPFLCNFAIVRMILTDKLPVLYILDLT